MENEAKTEFFTAIEPKINEIIGAARGSKTRALIVIGIDKTDNGSARLIAAGGTGENLTRGFEAILETDQLRPLLLRALAFRAITGNNVSGEKCEETIEEPTEVEK